MRPEQMDLSARLAELAEIDPESLVRTGDLGTTGDFSKHRDAFRRSIVLFTQLKDADLALLTGEQQQDLDDATRKALTLFRDLIPHFKADSPDAPDQRKQIEHLTIEVFGKVKKAALPIVAYSKATAGELEHIRQALDDALNETRRAVAEIQDIEKAARKAAGGTGVAAHARLFGDEAEEHLRRSTRWLRATVAVGAATITYGIVLWVSAECWGGAASASVFHTVQLAVAKLVIFAVLSFGVVWCGKNYRAERHNWVVNRHRQNALNTFETFAAAAGGDTETKNAVLLQATTSIFAPQTSGFVSSETESLAPSKVLEVFTDLSRSSGSK